MQTIEISTEAARLDIAVIHHWLSEESYWSQNIPEATLRKALENSLCFGAYDSASGQQIGLARVITDYATFAYLCDVFVIPEWQGQGIGKKLIEAVCTELESLKLRRWALATRDAHGLYEQYGFETAPEGHWMHRLFRDVYAAR